jgi:glycerol-3-phosphate dehydrogenase
VGGGITGVGVARDAASRGLKVALVEAGDFASGTSSKSSKLIHGGLRYLETFEFKLVFEALSERSFLMKSVPHLVRPLPFILPIYSTDRNGMFKISLGLWLYDLLALFRAPGFHKRLSRKQLLEILPNLQSENLVGGFQYYDASMWDDVLAVENARSAHQFGAHVANYVKAERPYWQDQQVRGFWVKEQTDPNADEFLLKAKRTVVCGGPWTDIIAETLARDSGQKWTPWLAPSQGVHLIFDKKRLSVPAAMVMSHPNDGRIVFVIPRNDFGQGVVIVGTTDGPSPENPKDLCVQKADVDYILALLARYFPELKLTQADVLSSYIGVRPLVGEIAASRTSKLTLQKVSREHHIGRGPGGVVFVAGGKYTTYRTMAIEIVDEVLKEWKKDLALGNTPQIPQISSSKTRVQLLDDPKEIEQSKEMSATLPESLKSRYGLQSTVLQSLREETNLESPDGFPWIEATFKFGLRYEMVTCLEDFFFRRMPLYLCRKDSGLPWAELLVKIWARELGKTQEQALMELHKLSSAIGREDRWRKS